MISNNDFHGVQNYMNPKINKDRAVHYYGSVFIQMCSNLEFIITLAS